MTDLTTVVARLRELEAAATEAPWEVAHDHESSVALVQTADGTGIAYDVIYDADAALIAEARNAIPALLAVAEAAALAAEDIGQCADPGLSPGAICRGLFPDNPEEWCGICALRDALAALNDPTREDT